MRSPRGSRQHPKRLGRGNASGKGTTAGKGTKGQRARTGGRNTLRSKGLRNLILSTPKLRGFKRQSPPVAIVDLGAVAEVFENGAVITPRLLARKGLVGAGARTIKILADGDIRKHFIIEGCRLSETARAKILAAGGEVR